MRDVAQSLLARIERAFPVVDMFWEECVRSTVLLGGRGEAPPGACWRRGMQLRVVGATRAASAWTTDMSAEGLRRAFERLRSGVEAPRVVPPWPSPLLVWHSEESMACWRAWGERLLSNTRARVPSDVMVHGCLTFEHADRGAAPASDRLVAWHQERVLLDVDILSADGSGVRHSQVLTLPSEQERELAEAAVLETVQQARATTGGLEGTLPVVLAPGGGALLLHEIVGHGLEADRVLTGASPFAGKPMGSTVSHPDLTVVDRTTARWGPGALEFDDEGQAAEPVVLIDHGKLAGVLHDRATAFVAGVKPTGNGRRASYEWEPAPRMRNIVVDAGPTDAASLLAGIDLGLYVQRVGGSVDPSTRSFALTVEAGRIIRHGVLSERVRGLTLRGDTLRTLRDVQGVGDDIVTSCQPIWCGKRGMVITGIAGPTVLLGRLWVSS